MATPFQVFWSIATRQALRTMSSMAARPLRRRLANNLQEINERLTKDPTSVGEIYRSSGPFLEFLAVHGILAFDFAVDEQHHLVCVRNCRAMTGRGFD
jgi:hypothetical protein